MKTNLHIPFASLLLLAVFSLQPLTLRAQGSLTPPGPPAQTMKTLDQVEARTPIGALPYSITSSGSYYLTTNLTGQAGSDGITVSADDVTIDLRGFAIVGVSGSLDGIVVSGINRASLAVYNGTIRNWGNHGVDASNAKGGQFRDLRVSENGGYGLLLGAETIVQSCTVWSNNSSGIRIGASGGVKECVCSGNGGVGIENYAFFPDLPHVLITCCNVHGNRGSGIAGNGTVIGNTCAGNAGAGIFMSSSGGMVEDNHVLRNYTGITLGASSSTNLVIRNVAIGNTNGAFVISGSGNVVGPVINSAGAATNSNPGANYSL